MGTRRCERAYVLARTRTRSHRGSFSARSERLTIDDELGKRRPSDRTLITRRERKLANSEHRPIRFFIRLRFSKRIPSSFLFLLLLLFIFTLELERIERSSKNLPKETCPLRETSEWPYASTITLSFRTVTVSLGSKRISSWGVLPGYGHTYIHVHSYTTHIAYFAFR